MEMRSLAHRDKGIKVPRAIFEVSVMDNGTTIAKRHSGIFSDGVEKLFRACASLWSATTFSTPKLAEYAEEILLRETRRGIRVMALLSLMIQLAVILYQLTVGLEAQYVYTCTMLALLSLLVYVSARLLGEVWLLYMLGMILLLISAAAVMFLAHAGGSLSPGLMASLVLLFMAMPLVPWGLREALGIVTLTYLLLILSTLSVPGRFDEKTLWALQFLTLASALVAGVLIARNVLTRKDDIHVRFGLETAHEELRLLSARDPLTGAWNRRFLEENLAGFSQKAQEENLAINFTLLDVDAFKLFNDNYGHDHGDALLKSLAAIFMDALPEDAHLVRLGGDEFAVFSIGSDCEKIVRRCLERIESDHDLLKVTGGEPVTISVGSAAIKPSGSIDLPALYRAADQDLYDAKRQIFSETLQYLRSKIGRSKRAL